MEKGILKLIKRTASIRRFKKQSIPKHLVNVIVEAGVWGPSLFGIQPWRFVVVKTPFAIKKVASIVNKDSSKAVGGVRKLLQICSKTIENCRLLIFVYNIGNARKTASRYGILYEKKAGIAELLASGAAIQNMFLTLTSLGLGGVWLDAPTIFPNSINKVLAEKGELVSVLAIGYPNQPIRRSFRHYNKLVRYF